MEDKEMLECAEKIKRMCKKTRNCKSCALYIQNDYGSCCKVTGHNPTQWKLPEKLILDDEEKQYLWNIIKPFKEKVIRIVKYSKSNLDDDEHLVIFIKNSGYTTLPYFKKGSMYKGMIQGRCYTVEELFGDKI